MHKTATTDHLKARGESKTYRGTKIWSNDVECRDQYREMHKGMGIKEFQKRQGSRRDTESKELHVAMEE